MAWNEPGNGGNKDRDPWSNNNRGGKDQGPPDLDEALRNLMSKLGLGGNKGGGRGSQKSGGFGAKGAGLLVALVVVIWFISGFYTVKEAERGVVQRFGAYHAEVGSGLHWRPRFIDTITNVDVNNISSQQTQGSMLTEDENVVSVEMGVQYRITNPRAYLFNVENPESSLSQLTDSALRYVIGHNTMDNILTVGRDEVRQQTRVIVETLIERYNIGISVVEVNFQGARPPEAVREAFDDAIRAQEDEERFIREAEAYARQIEPTARGRVRRMLQEASAYKQQVMLRAQGEVARYNELLPQYQAAPQVTRQRIFLETLERIYANNAKVFVDVEGGNNLMYLPLDKIMQNRAALTDSPVPLLPDNSGEGNPNQGNSNSQSSTRDISRDTSRYSNRGAN